MIKNSEIIFEVFVMAIGIFIIGSVGTIISWVVAIKIAGWDMCDFPEFIFLLGIAVSLILGIFIGKISCGFIKGMNLLN